MNDNQTISAKLGKIAAKGMTKPDGLTVEEIRSLSASVLRRRGEEKRQQSSVQEEA